MSPRVLISALGSSVPPLETLVTPLGKSTRLLIGAIALLTPIALDADAPMSRELTAHSAEPAVVLSTTPPLQFMNWLSNHAETAVVTSSMLTVKPAGRLLHGPSAEISTKALLTPAPAFPPTAVI